MARPTQESEANGAGEAHPERTLLTGSHQEIIGEASDGDGGERPVREKLKKTSIASLGQYKNSRTNTALQSDDLPKTTESHAEQADISNDAESAARGRPARKRSFDDLQNEDTQSNIAASQLGEATEKGSHHKRMRSRDISGSEGLFSNGQPRTEPLQYHDEEESDVDARRSPGGPGVLVEPPAVTETTPPPKEVTADHTILSPKKKRSRDQFDKDQDPKEEGSDDSGDSVIRSSSEPAENDDLLAQTTSRTATGEPEKKRPRDEELKPEISKTAGEVCCPRTQNSTQPISRLVCILILIFIIRSNRVLALRILQRLRPSQHSQGRNLLSQRTRHPEIPWNSPQTNPQLQPLHLHPQASQPSLAQKNLRSRHWSVTRPVRLAGLARLDLPNVAPVVLGQLEALAAPLHSPPKLQ